MRRSAARQRCGLLALFAALSTSLIGAPGGMPLRAAADESPHQLFLPLVQRLPGLGEPEACAAPDSPQALCPGQAGWFLACGGIGSVRDLVDLGEDGRVMAVGDGVASIRVDEAGRAYWSAQIGQALVGLESAVFTRLDDPQRPGWTGLAVGDQAQIVQQVGACWSEAPFDYFDASLHYRAVGLSQEPYSHAAAPRFGWVVGETRDPIAGTRWAAMASLDSTRLEDWFAWGDDDGLRELPPLIDVVTLWELRGFNEYEPQTWAIGEAVSGAGGLLARADGRAALRMEPVLSLPAGQQPMELARNSDPDLPIEAYALGNEWDAEGGLVGTMGWRYDLGLSAWESVPALRRDGRRLGDVYSQPLLGRGADPFEPLKPQLWLGFAPGAEAGNAIERIDWESAEILDDYAGSPPVAPASPGEPSPPLVIASVAVDRDAPEKELQSLVYSHGDRAWRFDVGAGTWRRERQRFDLLGFAPGESGGLALARAPAGGRVLRYENGELREDLALGAELSDFPRLTSIDGAGGRVWLAGASGTALRLGGALQAPRLFRLPPAEANAPRDIVDLAVAESGEVWALAASGEGEAAASQVWRFDPARERWRPLLEQPEPLRLRAVSAFEDTDGGQAWSVGDGAALWIGPSCEGGGLAPEPVPSGMAVKAEGSVLAGTEGAALAGTGEAVPSDATSTADCRCEAPGGGRGQRVCRFNDADLDLEDVSTTSPGAAWAVGRRGGVEALFRLNSAGEIRPMIAPDPLGSAAPGGIAPGHRFVAVAAGSPVDAWVVARCGRGAWRRLSGTAQQRYRSVACGDDPPYFSSILHFDGQGWSPLPRGGSEAGLATVFNVEIRDLKLRQQGDARELWLAGDWTTLAQRVYPVARE
jgi:hypothetical protein